MWNLINRVQNALQTLWKRLSSDLGRDSPHRTNGARFSIGSEEDAVSRLAILVLRAVAKSAEPLRPDHLRILPAQEILSDREAAVRLARMDKPLQCTASVSDGLLEITCQPLGPEGEWILAGKTALASQNGGWLGLLEYEAMEASGSSEIAFVGRDEYTIVPYEVAERLEREYVFLNSYTMIGDAPERFGIPSAATARWYSPSSSKTRLRTT